MPPPNGRKPIKGIVETLGRCEAGGLSEELLLRDFRPRVDLVLEEHIPERARFPVVNVHTHLGMAVERPGMSPEGWAERLGLRSMFSSGTRRAVSRRRYRLEEVVRIMDACNVERVVDLDGVAPTREYLRFYGDHPGRFAVFHVLSLRDIDDPGYGERRAAELEEAVSEGARGLKVHKALGLTVRDRAGRVVPVDDLRFDPVWERAGDLGVPVLIHVSDPAAFFMPVDRFNPAYVTLRYQRPEWSFYGPQYPKKEEILRQRDCVLERHPGTVFIGAHQGNYPENLGYVGSVLERHRNFHVEFSARLGTLGRQPYTARRHFIRYQDRILFGTDGCPSEAQYRQYFRFLETDDEYFDGRPWGDRIYGIHLPDEVLEKVYRGNAEKLIPR